MRDHIVTEMLHALAVLDCNEEPDLDLLLAAHPNLGCFDWISYSAHFSAWVRTLAGFTTPQLAWLAKSLVILERDLSWPSGTDSVSIWVFQAYQARKDADASALADWILRHRSANAWTPSGTWPFEAYIRGREWQHWQYEVSQEREELERRRRAEKARATQARAKERRHQGLERSKQRLIFLDRLIRMEGRDMLIFLSTDRSFPIEAIPEIIIESGLHAALHLPADVRLSLLRRLDRRKARRWRSFRRALQAEPC
jgi:hypothetical protein